MKTVEIVLNKKKNLKNSILLEGIMGVGSVAHISVDYIIEKTGAELIGRVYSNLFPNAVLINDDSMVELPYYSLYYKKVKNKKILFMIGSHQPEEPDKSFLFCEELVKEFKKMGVKQIITIAGIALHSAPRTIRLHCVTNDHKMIKGLKKYDLVFDGAKSVALIIGIAGLLLGFAEKQKIPAICILATTWAHPSHLGIKESKKVISFLSEYLGFKIDLKDIDKEIKKINITKEKIFKEAEKRRNRYIG